ncbi:hypothetical protein ABTU70_19500, partial [Acinetobacter baumannii]
MITPEASALGHRYLVALGSNVAHPHYGLPPAVLRAAVRSLAQAGLEIAALAPLVASVPLGPS